MGRMRRGCSADVPDCENCPYPDCWASVNDIKRQLAYENKLIMEARNNKIYKLKTVDGLSFKDIGERYGISDSRVHIIIQKITKKEMAAAL